MSLATSGVTAGIVLFNLTTGITAVASVMLAVFILAMVLFAVAPLFSSTWIGQQDVTSTATSHAEPSDD
ncbi:hypothetical protein [Natrinema sp. SYSU A 869]|uniref:hypothetical protein n=1 Tax=Natrinema sp. SYSU A 869 TaxID=2871694 RepID=UPI001CA3E5BC|nr:hypothetical protein [Natrinema sp. SYSU A 869]